MTVDRRLLLATAALAVASLSPARAATYVFLSETPLKAAAAQAPVPTQGGGTGATGATGGTGTTGGTGATVPSAPMTISAQSITAHQNVPFAQDGPSLRNAVVPVLFSVLGPLPVGVTVDAATGAISGTSPTLETVAVRLTATDASGRKAATTITITVVP